MRILHDPVARAFFLQGPGSTYAFRVGPAGRLEHLHWGEQVGAQDLGWSVLHCDRAFSPNPDPADRSWSADTLAQECPSAAGCDYRAPMIEVRHGDGSRVLELVYAGHRLVAGKPRLDGLPATYCEADTEAETLVVELCDAPTGLAVELSYTVFAAHDVIARSVRVINRGAAPVTLLRVLSASVDLEGSGLALLQLSGSWARERHVHVTSLRPGLQAVESRRGTSSHQHNPFIALLDTGTGEESGRVWAANLVYSGNFFAGVELDQFMQARLHLGIHPDGFAWELAPGTAFQAPEAILAFSAHGLGALSRTLHRLYRTRLCRGRWRDAERPVLLNNWEATYFNFTPERLLTIARSAKEAGIELFVLDDGWFGKRESDVSGLGDWVVNEAKLPGGLARLAREVEAIGLRFGLWFEPEMVSPDSDLYRAHPDWCLHAPGRTRSQGRNQLVLDVGRAEVREHIRAAVAQVLRAAPISYVKWDMNRHLTEVGSLGLPAHRQGEAAHRFVLGVYEVMERLTAEFPDVLFEGCSGGGGRFDPGILHYMPQVWTSDNSDAVSRLWIQHGTSIAYPLSSMAAHVSAVPNHQVHRTTSFATRAAVAFTGSFGFELDLARQSPEDMAEAKAQVAAYKRLRSLLARGDLYRLADPAGGRLAAWMVVAADGGEALVTAVRIRAEAHDSVPVVRLRGLDPAARYRLDDGNEVGGDALMAVGLRHRFDRDYQARTWHLVRV